MPVQKFWTKPVSTNILTDFRWTWVQFPSVPISIRGRVVEGTGLIILFPLERRWFEPSRMQMKNF